MRIQVGACHIDRINEFLPEIYSGLSGGREKISSLYVANKDDSILAKELKKARKEDAVETILNMFAHTKSNDEYIDMIIRKRVI